MDDKGQYKNKLQEEEKLLTEELETVGKRNPRNPKDWEVKPVQNNRSADPNEVADGFEAYDENAGVLNELEIRLANVQKALKKIEDSSYGTCEVCGEEIDKERLGANPAASTCRAHME